MRRFPFKAVVLGFALLVLCGPAAAVTFDSVGDSFTVDFGGNIEGSDVPGLTASALLTVQSISSNSVALSITLSNTTGAPWDSAGVSAFGFDTSPNVSSATLSSSVFGNVNLGKHFPNGFGGIDVCIINNRNNCTGGAGGGLEIGESTQALLTLNFAGSVGAIELDNFGVRYQSLSSKELGFSGASGTGRVVRPGNPIPEPGSIAMFLLGGLLVAAFVSKQVLTARG